ncbi:MAG: proprotein convertase P-domain-containing protein [Myxococcota bacterium]|nr:proprotein convertase P-domain-containing protein [Myxococcota bacterium]
MRKNAFVGIALLAMVVGCSEEDDTPPPPPQTATAPTTPQAPPGQVMVTVVANSTPPGATVVGGGRQLGQTPLQTQVPIPTPTPGQVQTFAFNFQLAGYQPATINAAPVNNTITITAALAPATPPQEVATGDDGDDGDEGDDGDDANEIRVNGRGGGAIYDHHTTRGAAVVGQSCVIDRLRVRLRGNHTFNRDLRITLTDPQGRSYMLQNNSSRNPFRTYVVRRAAGRQARGQWNLAVADTLGQDSGRLTGWYMSLRCR